MEENILKTVGGNIPTAIVATAGVIIYVTPIAINKASTSSNKFFRMI